MKIGVYTICLNEEMFAQRFMDCIKNEADGVFVTDTGSTDRTVEILRENGAVVNVIKWQPWRFDVPRNISMNFVPEDYDVCVCIDLDEVLMPGWRAEVEASYAAGNIDRLRYKYVWNHNPDGSEGITFWYDKIHTRKGFRWIKPVHEVLEFDGVERQGFNNNIKLIHYPDSTKSRGSYLPLLELACRENPDDDRSSHYLGREYMYYGMNEKSIVELKRHLELPSAKWRPERAASMRFMARCYDRLGYPNEAHEWFLRSCAESPIDREPWVELGKHYYAQGNHPGAYYAMKQALNIKEKTPSYICEPFAWDATPYDIASVAAFNLGLYPESYDLAVEASNLNPSDERLKNNVQLIKAKLQ